MVQIPAKLITLDEFLQRPETKPASEYIEGQIFQKPIPQGKHSIIQGELLTAINAIIKPTKIARAFPELRCTFGDRSIVPDIAIFRWNRIPRDTTNVTLRDRNGEIANTFKIAPDWTIEILSPDQSKTKVTKNILHCLKYGTQMGWLIDPKEKTVFVYFPQQKIEVFDQFETKLPVPNFASHLNLNVSTLFGWLLE